MSVQWTQVLSVGVASNEGLHGELLLKMGEFLDARSRGGDKEIGQVVESFVDYLVARFTSPTLRDQICFLACDLGPAAESLKPAAASNLLLEEAIVPAARVVLDLHVGYLTSN